MRRRPPRVLVTTPESLYLVLTSPRGRDMLRMMEAAPTGGHEMAHHDHHGDHDHHHHH